MKYKDIKEEDLIIALNELDKIGVNVWVQPRIYEQPFYSIESGFTNTSKLVAVLAAYLMDINQYIFKGGKFKWPSITRYPKIIYLTVKLVLTIIKIYKQ